MNLADVLFDVGVGFVGGFGIGVSGVTDRTLDNLQYLEAVHTEKELEEKKIGEKERRVVGSVTLAKRFLYSSVWGLLCGAASPFLVGGDAVGHSVYAVGGALLGNVVGAGVRIVARREKVNDWKIIGDLRENPKDFVKHLPRERRNAVEAALGELEDRIVGGEDIDGFRKSLLLPGSISERMHRAITQDERVYTQEMLVASGVKFADVYGNAVVQRRLSEFYDSQPRGGCGIMGYPESMKIRVYEMDGERLFTYTARFKELKHVDDEKKGESFAMGRAPEITNVQEIGWKGSYREMASEILSYGGDYTTMLVHAPPGGFLDMMRGFIVTSTFIPAFDKHQREKRKESSG